MTHKNIIYIGAIIGVIVLVIIGGFIVLDYNNDKNNKQKIGDENITNFSHVYVEPVYIENTTKQGETYYSTFRELNRTADPQFKIGEKYFYHWWEEMPGDENNIQVPMEYNTTIEVMKIDVINKSNYYILKSQEVSVYLYILKKGENGVWKKIRGEPPGIFEGDIIGVNEENGEVLEVNIQHTCPVLKGMFAKWMLYIDKGVKWLEKSNISGFEKDGSGILINEQEWTVADIEKINGIDCFKVISISKTETVYSEGKQISGEIITYWIDIKKRILIKMEKREDGVLTEMIELKNYEKP